MRCSWGIFFTICCFYLPGCVSVFKKQLSLSYTISVVDTAQQIFDIQLVIQGASSGDFEIRSYSFQEQTNVKNFRAAYETGEPIKVQHVETKVGIRGNNYTEISKILTNNKIGDIRVSYQMRVGTNFAPHGVQHFDTHGYMCDRFALVSGRNIFLLPTDPISSARMRFDVPKGWEISVPWDPLDGWFAPSAGPSDLKAELVNTAIALGFLERRTRRIGDTDVLVCVFKDWDDKTKRRIYQAAFSIYDSVQDLFGGGGTGRYVFNFVPKTDDDIVINASAWSTSQGSEMVPITGERWLACTESLIDRWVKYPPFNMIYESQEDFWIVDGIRRYYAIRIGEELGWLDGRRYWEAEHTRFAMQVANRNLNTPVSDQKEKVPSFADVRELFTSQSKILEKKRKSIAPTVMSFVERVIQRETRGKFRFEDVLRYQYAKRKGLSLLRDIRKIAGAKVAEELPPFLHDVTKIPRKLGMVRPLPDFPAQKLQEGNSGRMDTLRLLLTGETLAHLEHCGCKANQNGGIARRATYVAQKRRVHSDILVLDTGNLFPISSNHFRLTEFDEKELAVYLAAVGEIGYDMAGISFNELYYGYPFFQRNALALDFPFVCANVVKDGVPIALPYISVRMGDYQIGLLGIFQRPTFRNRDETYLFDDRTAELDILDPVDTIVRYLPKLRKENDLVMVIGTLEPDLIVNQVSRLDGIDMIISRGLIKKYLVETDGGTAMTHLRLSGFQNGTLVIYEQTGLYSIDTIELWVDQDTGIVDWRRENTPLNEEIEDDELIRSIIDNLYSSVIDVEIRPLMNWDERFAQSEYVGVDACKTCHPSEHTQWKTTRHAFAINTLLDVRRHFQPKCVVCHVTGMGYETGYEMGDLKHPLINVQCEMCHGPGGDHIRNPWNSEMIRVPSAQHCVTCHDQEHSDFVFDTYYPKVKH